MLEIRRPSPQIPLNEDKRWKWSYEPWGWGLKYGPIPLGLPFVVLIVLVMLVNLFR
jgi:hypothetical protein